MGMTATIPPATSTPATTPAVDVLLVPAVAVAVGTVPGVCAGAFAPSGVGVSELLNSMVDPGTSLYSRFPAMSRSFGWALVPLRRADDFGARVILLPSWKRMVAGALDVAISSPITIGDEDTPGAETKWPSTVNACGLYMVARGVEARLANPKLVAKVSKSIERFIKEPLGSLYAAAVNRLNR